MSILCLPSRDVLLTNHVLYVLTSNIIWYWTWAVRMFVNCLKSEWLVNFLDRRSKGYYVVVTLTKLAGRWGMELLSHDSSTLYSLLFYNNDEQMRKKLPPIITVSIQYLYLKVNASSGEISQIKHDTADNHWIDNNESPVYVDTTLWLVTKSRCYNGIIQRLLLKGWTLLCYLKYLKGH